MRKIKFGNHIQDYGYFIVPNLLIDKRNNLGIDDGELSFLLIISRFSSGWTLRDEQIDAQTSSRTMQRRRKSLKEKGLIDFYERKVKTEKGWVNYGIVYDLTPLENKLNELYNNEINKKKEENPEYAIEEILTFYKEKLDLFIKNCPISIREKIEEPWINMKEWYNLKSDYDNLLELSEDVLDIVRISISKIDLYLLYHFSVENPKQIVPRLSLFLKNPKYFYDLVNFKTK